MNQSTGYAFSPQYITLSPHNYERATFIRQFVQSHYDDGLGVDQLLADAARIYDTSIKAVK